MAQRDVLDAWDAAIEKARTDLARALERKDTAEHPDAVKRFGTSWEAVNRIARDALPGERDS